MRTSLQIMDSTMPVGSLTAYIQRVNQVPVLTAEEEHALAVRFREHNDLEAARKLVMSHLRFVVKIAKGYMGYGLALADLIQEGSVGLMKAVKRFDPDVGVRLVSFAVHWIKAEIHEFVLRNWRIVKVATTKAQRKLFFNLRKNKKRLGWFSKNEVEDVAKTLNIKPKTVLEMESRLSTHDAAFDRPYHTSSEQTFAPVDHLKSAAPDPAQLVEMQDWKNDSKTQLTKAFQQLDARSKLILQHRWLSEKKTTLQALADEYGVSAERIRQLEQQALEKLKTLMSKKAA